MAEVRHEPTTFHSQVWRTTPRPWETTRVIDCEVDKLTIQISVLFCLTSLLEKRTDMLLAGSQLSDSYLFYNKQFC